jgi:DNA-binding NtrC family response regulator
LISHFITQFNQATGHSVEMPSGQILEALMAYDWPGNIRELENLIERLVILTTSERVDEDDVRAALPAGALSGGGSGARDGYYAPGVALKDILEACERDVVVRALEHHKGNATHAARDLGLERSHFYKKMRALGIKRPGAQDDDEGDT